MCVFRISLFFYSEEYNGRGSRLEAVTLSDFSQVICYRGAGSIFALADIFFSPLLPPLFNCQKLTSLSGMFLNSVGICLSPPAPAQQPALNVI